MSRPAYVYALAVIGLFAALGAGLGLAANFTLGFFIEQFVDPGTDPLDSTQVGIMFLVSIFFIYATGPRRRRGPGAPVRRRCRPRRPPAAPSRR